MLFEATIREVIMDIIVPSMLLGGVIGYSLADLKDHDKKIIVRIVRKDENK